MANGSQEKRPRRDSYVYDMGERVSVLNHEGLNDIASRLVRTAGGITPDWRTLADKVGFSLHEIGQFETLINPAFEMLRTWSTREGSTLRVLEYTLKEMGRYDVLDVLDERLTCPFTLQVVLHKDGDDDDDDDDWAADQGGPCDLIYINVLVTGLKDLKTVLAPELAKQHIEIESMKFQQKEVTWDMSARLCKGKQLDLFKLSRFGRAVSGRREPAFGPRFSSAHEKHNTGRTTWTKPVLRSKSQEEPAVNNLSREDPPPVPSLEDNNASSTPKYDATHENPYEEPLPNRILPPKSSDDPRMINDDGSNISEVPGLDFLPGWSPHLPNCTRKIHVFMRPFRSQDGWYVVRQLDGDRLAISVTHNQKVLHYKIHQQLDSDGCTSFYLYRSGYHSNSIFDLIKYYSTNNLTDPRDNSNGHVRLLRPITGPHTP